MAPSMSQAMKGVVHKEKHLEIEKNTRDSKAQGKPNDY